MCPLKLHAEQFKAAAETFDTVGQHSLMTAGADAPFNTSKIENCVLSIC